MGQGYFVSVPGFECAYRQISVGALVGSSPVVVVAAL